MPGRPSGVVFAQNRALCSVKLSTPQYMLTSMELVAKTNRRQTNQWQEKLSVKKGFNEVAIFPARIGQSVQRDFIETAARQLPNRTARSVWSARSLLPLSDRPTLYNSASKLDALQTPRVPVHPRRIGPLLSLVLCLAPLVALPASSPNSAPWQFEITVKKDLPI